MSKFLKKYISEGLTNIFVIDHQWNEEPGGFQNENTTEIIIARRASKYFKFEANEYTGPPKHSFSLTEIAELSEQDYKELSKEHEIIDTPKALQAIEEANTRAKRQLAREEPLVKLAPKCPQCGEKLTPKSGPHGPFWGCPRYPYCKGNKKMNAKAQNLYDEWAKGK